MRTQTSLAVFGDSRRVTLRDSSLECIGGDKVTIINHFHFATDEQRLRMNLVSHRQEDVKTRFRLETVPQKACKMAKETKEGMTRKERAAGERAVAGKVNDSGMGGNSGRKRWLMIAVVLIATAMVFYAMVQRDALSRRVLVNEVFATSDAPN
ncbi:hypothetical protein VKT23_009907 [Stygiomarasmius scandens]|uniref:Uncharacterized protein n=1 Tax=Marasmiellus scandens TaxID=2682957 RepID=A0ABR1JH03_9AGAR